jgi:membrane-bound ClpP family serine protease
MLSFFIIGTTVYIANNGALSMLSLSSQYQSAVSPAEKSFLEAAGTVIVAQSEDFTPGTFPGFLILNLSSILLMVVMVKGQIFSKWMGVAGTMASILLILFTVLATYFPELFSQAMLLAMIGGVIMLVWNIWISRSMFRLSRQV